MKLVHFFGHVLDSSLSDVQLMLQRTVQEIEFDEMGRFNLKKSVEKHLLESHDALQELFRSGPDGHHFQWTPGWKSSYWWQPCPSTWGFFSSSVVGVGDVAGLFILSLKELFCRLLSGRQWQLCDVLLIKTAAIQQDSFVESIWGLTLLMLVYIADMVQGNCSGQVSFEEGIFERWWWPFHFLYERKWRKSEFIHLNLNIQKDLMLILLTFLQLHVALSWRKTYTLCNYPGR